MLTYCDTATAVRCWGGAHGYHLSLYIWWSWVSPFIVYLLVVMGITFYCLPTGGHGYHLFLFSWWPCVPPSMLVVFLF